MPAGIQPPIIVQYNASSVPVLQISLSSDSLNEQQLYDYGIYRLRQRLAPIHGVTLPTPAGGKYRQIMVDLDPAKLQAQGSDAARRGQRRQRAEPDPALGHREDRRHAICRAHQCDAAALDDLNNIPVKFVNGATVFVKDVGHVRDGCAGAAERGARRRPPLGSAQHHQERQRLDARRRQRGQGGARRSPRAAAPPGMQITELFDQSVFVNAIDRRRAARGRHRGRR